MNGTEELHYIDSYDKVQAVVDRVSSIREAFGDGLGIGVDFHGRVHKPMAKVLAKALEPYHPMFLEEVVLPENWEVFPQIASEVAVPLATGERLYSRWEFKRLFQRCPQYFRLKQHFCQGHICKREADDKRRFLFLREEQFHVRQADWFELFRFILRPPDRFHQGDRGAFRFGEHDRRQPVVRQPRLDRSGQDRRRSFRPRQHQCDRLRPLDEG